MKKAQIEIVGLLIIVLLIIFILIFFLRLGGCERSEIIGETRSSIEVNNLVNAMMDVTTRYNKPMFRVVVDCYEANDISNEYCVYAKTEIGKIIDLAFEKEPEYQFKILTNNVEFNILRLGRGNCEFGKTANYFRKANNVNFNIMLKLCE